ncbi:MAG: hypothetical protein B6D55_07930 [Candidatus Omnitrophica bacterium 4484_70.2]|nr:MAG: hypothetical protein B6D55_07930 [Candidatus Omnitrophica bacterium 4484_70.2]
MMKKISIFLFIVIFLVGLAYTFLYIFLNTEGKNILLGLLEKKFKIKAQLESLTFRFPFKLFLNNFQWKELNIGETELRLGMSNPFTRQIVISKLYMKDLKFTLHKEKKREGKKELIPIEKEKRNEITSSLPRSKFFLKFNQIIIENGLLEFEDNTLSPPLKLALKDIKILIKNFRYPEIEKFFVELNASPQVEEKEIKNALSILGWIDWKEKNMDLALNLNNFDYFMLSNYYPPFWKPENLKLKEAILSLKAHLLSENDNLLIDYYIILEKANFSEEPEVSSEVETFKKILSLFEKDGKATVHLQYKTKMSSPEFKLTSIGEGLLNQIQKIDPDFTSNIITKFLQGAQETVEGGIKGLKGLTIDPAMGAAKSFLNEFLKNFKEIIEKK